LFAEQIFFSYTFFCSLCSSCGLFFYSLNKWALQPQLTEVKVQLQYIELGFFFKIENLVTKLNGTKSINHDLLADIKMSSCISISTFLYMFIHNRGYDLLIQCSRGSSVLLQQIISLGLFKSLGADYCKWLTVKSYLVDEAQLHPFIYKIHKGFWF